MTTLYSADRTNAGSPAAVELCDDAARYDSLDEMMSSDWAELVIRLDRKTGEHVVRTACCPMAPVC